MNVEWADAARESVTRVATDLRQWSVPAAEKLVEAVAQAALRIERFPESGRIVPEFATPLIREVIVARYRLVYERFPDRVEIVAFHPSAIPFD